MRLALLLLMAAAVSPPSVVQRTNPEYTTEALEAKLQGVVVLATIVTAEGIPSEIKVVRGLGMGLDEKAIECLRQWRFTPGTRMGEPIPVRAQIEIRFRLPHENGHAGITRVLTIQD